MEMSERKYPTEGPKFKVGEHVSVYNSYWGRRTGVVTEYIGIGLNVDGPCTANHTYRYVDDVTGKTQWCSEKKMKKCRKPKI